MTLPMTLPITLPTRRTAAAGLVLAAALTAVPALAAAHVRVIADNTTSDSFSQLTFRVPTESDTASTVKLQVQLPKDRPLLYVATMPVPGWTAKTVEATLPKPVKSYGTTITKAVSTVTWTADNPGSAIRPGEYQEFSISAGPLSTPGDVLLPATQTYSDGAVVAWNEPASASGEEPEHPAPVLTVTAVAPPTPAPATGTDRLARGLGIAGLAVGIAGVVVALLAARRSAARLPT